MCMPLAAAAVISCSGTCTGQAGCLLTVLFPAHKDPAADQPSAVTVARSYSWRPALPALVTAAADGDAAAVQQQAEAPMSSVHATALLAAATATAGHAEVVRILSEAGVALNVANVTSTTALHCAAYKGHAAVVGLLLTKHADPIAGNDPRHGTPLHQAAIAGHADIAAALLGAGADPCGPDHMSTPLNMAAFYGHLQVV